MTEARFLSDKPRQKPIALEWPIGLGDVEYRTVVLRRLTTAEVDDFVTRLRELPEGATFRFPIFFDEAGAPVPDEVWEALDPDDRDRLNEAADDFLPARWKRAATAETSQTGSNSTLSMSDTGDSSSAASPQAGATPAT